MVLAVIRSVLGRAIVFNCESQQIVLAIHKIYPPSQNIEPSSGIQLFIEHAKEEATKLSCPPIFDVDQTHFKGRTGSSKFSADRLLNTGNAHLCSQMLSNEYLLRHQVLNALCYYLLSYKTYLPVHAACFQWKKHLIMCIGRSGMGKSTLAMAAMQRNLAVYSEDLCFVGSTADLGVKADCREFHLYPDSYQKFFVDGYNKTKKTSGLSHNGKQKHIVQNKTAFDNSERSPKADLTTVLLFLEQNHQSKYSELSLLTDEIPFNALSKPKEAGFNLDCEVRTEAVGWLKQQNCYQGYLGYCFDSFFSQLDNIQEVTQ